MKGFQRAASWAKNNGFVLLSNEPSVAFMRHWLRERGLDPDSKVMDTLTNLEIATFYTNYQQFVRAAAADMEKRSAPQQ